MNERDQEMHQIGALPILVKPDGSIEVCLITSRGGGRWIIPKGNPISGLAPHEVAAREALEEAGLVGQAERHCIGTFTFNRQRGGREMNCSVDVYALKVERQLTRWNEMGQRSVLRCNVEMAMSLVSAPNLAILINQYVEANSCLRTG
jgi:ADP-ribose pyrophosphatase YjhB (NUDIX family)